MSIAKRAAEQTGSKRSSKKTPTKATQKASTSNNTPKTPTKRASQKAPTESAPTESPKKVGRPAKPIFIEGNYLVPTSRTCCVTGHTTPLNRSNFAKVVWPRLKEANPHLTPEEYFQNYKCPAVTGGPGRPPQEFAHLVAERKVATAKEKAKRASERAAAQAKRAEDLAKAASA